MPNLSGTLLGKAGMRKFYNYRFEPLYTQNPAKDLRLQDKVVEKRDKNNAAPCLQEVAQMMACWKKHDFNQAKCAEEMQAFYKCQEKAETLMARKREQEAKGNLQTRGHMNSRNLNSLLGRFPEPKDKKSR